jgi:hypothetical protein
MNLKEMSVDELVAANQTLAVEYESIRAQRIAIVSEIRERNDRLQIEAAVRRAFGDSRSVVIEGGVITIKASDLVAAPAADAVVAQPEG